MHELADALRDMGNSERDIQQLLMELVAPFPQPYSHNADVPLVGSRVTVPNTRKAHVVPDVNGTGLVDKHELPEVWREMSMTERETQQRLNELNLESCKELVTPSPQPYFHNDDVPMVGSRVTELNSRKTHDAPVLDAITKSTHTYDIVREKADSADEESLAHISGGSDTEEMESVPLPKNPTTFRRPYVRTRHVPLCWHGAQCPWHRRGRCLFKHEARKSSVTGEKEIKAEMNALWTALRKLAASLMWRTSSANAATSAACLVENPTVQEQMIVQENPEVQVMERIQGQDQKLAKKKVRWELDSSVDRAQDLDQDFNQEELDQWRDDWLEGMLEDDEDGYRQRTPSRKKSGNRPRLKHPDFQ